MEYHVELIKKWEGLRLEAYLPTPQDRWTIGYGHTGDVSKGDTVTNEQAEVLLLQDIAWAEKAVDDLVIVPLMDRQRSALISFTYNIGKTAFAKSTLLRKLNSGDYDGAAEEFPRWNKQKGKVLKGLVNRRADEQALFQGASQNVDLPNPRPDEVQPLKPLVLSKEMATGFAAVLAGAGTFVTDLNDFAQNIAVGSLSAMIILFGGFIMYNRLSARSRGER